MDEKNGRLLKALSLAQFYLVKIRDYCEHDGTACLELCDCSTFMSLKAAQAIRELREITDEVKDEGKVQGTQ